MWKVIKRIGSRTVAKYYLEEAVARKKAEYKGWKLSKHDGGMEYSARSINKGALESPRYMIEIPSLDVQFGCPTEGLTNQIVELLSLNYSDVRARHVEIRQVEEEEIESEI